MDRFQAFITTLLALSQFAIGGVIDRDGLRYRRMSGGTVSGACSYPGAVALTNPTQNIYCMGAHNAGNVIVPLECAKLIKTVNANSIINIKGGDGTGTGSINKGAMTVKDNLDGTATVGPLATPLPAGTCATANYTLYPSANLSAIVEAATCTVVSYSGSVNATLFKYDGQLKTAPLVASPLLACGTLVLANVASSITTTSFGTVSTTLYSTRNVTITKTASAAFCKGDLGAPIYCPDPSSNTNTNVLVGLVGSSQCQAGETFLSYDLTRGKLAGFSLSCCV